MDDNQLLDAVALLRRWDSDAKFDGHEICIDPLDACGTCEATSALLARIESDGRRV